MSGVTDDICGLEDNQVKGGKHINDPGCWKNKFFSYGGLFSLSLKFITINYRAITDQDGGGCCHFWMTERWRTPHWSVGKETEANGRRGEDNCQNVCLFFMVKNN